MISAVFLVTIILPLLPWIALAPYLLLRRPQPRNLWILFSAGLALDLWWGKPLGLTPLVLLALFALTSDVARIWPTNGRVWLAGSLVVSVVAMELYLALL